MAEPARQLPLAGYRFGVGNNLLEAAPQAERIALRADSAEARQIGDALGLRLPDKPKTSSKKKDRVAIWLGPDEWLLLAKSGSAMMQALPAKGIGPYSAVDVSHRNTGILVSGEDCENVLNAGCPLDLSRSKFPVGAATRTVLGKAEIILLRETSTRFRVECWRSFSDYVWRFLSDAVTSG